jgi:hypothetical protein
MDRTQVVARRLGAAPRTKEERKEKKERKKKEEKEMEKSKDFIMISRAYARDV